MTASADARSTLLSPLLLLKDLQWGEGGRGPDAQLPGGHSIVAAVVGGLLLEQKRCTGRLSVAGI